VVGPTTLLGARDPAPQAPLRAARLVTRPQQGRRDVGRAATSILRQNARTRALSTILEKELERVEQEFLVAIEDDEFSAQDLRALRKFPSRLKNIRSLAEQHEMRLRQARTPILREAQEDHRLVSAFGDELAAVEKLRERAVAVNDSLSSTLSSQQLVIAQRQASEAERFQRTVTLIGSAVLVPALIASIFGANVAIRGQDTVQAAYGMLAFMVAGGALSFAAITFANRDYGPRLRAVMRRDRAARMATAARFVTDKGVDAAILIAVGLAGAGVGIAFLLSAPKDPPPAAQRTIVERTVIKEVTAARRAP
jgi:hypothetical protein